MREVTRFHPGAVVIDMNRPHFRFDEGELHRHHCPTCFEAVLCEMDCSYEEDQDDPDVYDEPFGCVAECSTCEARVECCDSCDAPTPRRRLVKVGPSWSTPEGLLCPSCRGVTDARS